MREKKQLLFVEVDEANFELECALDNLQDVHAAMESEEGANWQQHCNAVFACYLMLHSIHERLNALVDKEATA